MASTSMAASSFTATLAQDVSPQAGPMPSKRGEIGFVEGMEQRRRSQDSQVEAGASQEMLPGRHPADRPPTPSTGPAASSPAAPAAPSPGASTDNLSTNSMAKRSFLGRKNVPKFFGICLDTLLIFLAQILLLGGTIAAWAISAIVVNKKIKKSSTPSDPSNPSITMANSSVIFVHVAFAIVALTELVFLERRIFRIRAERYGHVHPGEMLPRSLRRGAARDAGMPMVPWQRPPLPTYAAALAQSGVGTGDVEDSLIAQPPPPAYGKTRGSTLLLAGFLRNSLRAQARELETDRPTSHMSVRSDRPVSFRSIDEEWETRRDAARARTVEETLTAMESGEAGHLSDHR